MLDLYKKQHHPLRRLTHTERKEPPAGLIIAGVVVVGLGLIAWSYLGADLRRYLKIHSM